MILLSLDIDGTLEVGEPPGPLQLELIPRARALGYIVGSCSDRTIGDQRRLWQRVATVVDFVSLKHGLEAATSSFGATRRVHIGDSIADERYSILAGFEFWHVEEIPTEMPANWVLDALATAPREGF